MIPFLFGFITAGVILLLKRVVKVTDHRTNAEVISSWRLPQGGHIEMTSERVREFTGR